MPFMVDLAQVTMLYAANVFKEIWFISFFSNEVQLIDTHISI
jgi:hypothetical protein